MPDPRKLPRGKHSKSTPRTGVKIDLSKMNDREIMGSIDNSQTTQWDEFWEDCYKFSVIFERGQWMAGINGKPTFEHYWIYVRRLNEENGSRRDYTQNHVGAMVDCYRFYADPSALGMGSEAAAEEAVAMVKQLGNITKAHIAVPFIKNNRDKIRKIFELCYECNQTELRTQLKLRFPLKGGQRKHPLPETPESRWRAITPTSVLKFLSEKSNGLIGNEMAVDRRVPYSRAEEVAFYCIGRAYLDSKNLDWDGWYYEKFSAWMAALDPAEAATLLREAKTGWKTLMKVVDPDNDEAEWPFESAATAL